MLYTKLFFRIALLQVGFSSVTAMFTIVKLKQRISRERLEQIISEGNHEAKSPDEDSNKFYIDVKTPDKKPIGYFKLLKELTERFEKSSPPLAVEYIRSLRFCPGIPELLINPTIAGEKPNGFALSCEGGDVEGVYWNEKQLQDILDAHHIGNIKSIQFSAEDDVSRFLNNLTLLNSISESELPLIAGKYNNLTLNERENLRLNLTNDALRALDASLLKISLQRNDSAEAIYSNFAVRVEKIGETNSEGIMFVDQNRSTSKGELVAVMKNTSTNDVQKMGPR
jgi:hypothetical protein